MKIYPPMLVVILSTGTAHSQTVPQIHHIDSDGLISSDEAQQAIEAARAQVIERQANSEAGFLSDALRAAVRASRHHAALNSVAAENDGEFSIEETSVATALRHATFEAQIETGDEGRLSNSDSCGQQGLSAAQDYRRSSNEPCANTANINAADANSQTADNADAASVAANTSADGGNANRGHDYKTNDAGTGGAPDNRS